jgi:hypothetical protein
MDATGAGLYCSESPAMPLANVSEGSLLKPGWYECICETGQWLVPLPKQLTTPACKGPIEGPAPPKRAPPRPLIMLPKLPAYAAGLGA